MKTNLFHLFIISIALLIFGCSAAVLDEESLSSEGSAALPVIVGDGAASVSPETSVPLVWEVTGGQSERVAIEVSFDGGETWVLVETNILNAGSHSFDVPKIPGAIFRVRVVGSDNETIAESEPVVIEGSVPTLVMPGGTADIEAGVPVELTWTTNDDQSTTVDIWASVDGAEFQLVEAGVTNDGNYEFLTPDMVGSTIVVRVEDSNLKAILAQSPPLEVIEIPLPTVTILSPVTGPTNNALVPITIEFSEPVQGFDISDVIVSSGTITNFSGSGTTFTFELDVTGTDGTFTIDVDSSVAENEKGKGNEPADQFRIIYDTTSPTAVISSPSAVTNVNPIPIVIEFGEPVDEFDLSDVVVPGGTISGFTGSGSSYSFYLTVGGPGTFSIDINSAQLTDIAGNDNLSSAQFNVVFDTSSPTVVLSTTSTDPTNDNPIPVSVVFSEPVTGFDSSEIALSSGSISSFSGSGTHYTFDLNVGGTGAYTVDVSSGVAQDLAGNGNQVASQLSINYDEESPTVAITSVASNPTSTDPISVDISFSESVTGFNSSDILVSGGSVTGFSGSGANYSFDLDVSDSDGVYTVDVNSGVAQDAAGNDNLAATQFSIQYDNNDPTVSISSSSSSPTNGDPIPIDIVFNEPVSGFDSSDVTVSGGSITGFSGSGTSYSFNLDVGDADGTYTVDVPADVAQDIAGNGNEAATQFSIDYDNTDPTVTVSSSASNPTNGDPISVDIVFSESVTGFASSDITVSGGVISGFSGTGDTYSFDLDVSDNDGTYTVDINSGAAQDGAGNDNEAATQFSIQYDGTRPTVTVSSTEPSTTNVDPIPISITFNEPVTGFTSSDITVSGGSVTAFSGSGDSYSFDLDVSDADGSYSIDVNASVATDDAGNDNQAATQLVIEYDNTAPTVTISSAESNPAKVDPIPIDIVFSESVTGFTSSDISISGGTIQNFSGVGNTYSFDLEVSDTPGSYTVDVGDAAAQDGASNTSEAATQFSINYEIPTIQEIVDGFTATTERVALFKGEPATTVTLNFGQAATREFDIDYAVFGEDFDRFAEVLQEPGDVISVSEGATQVQFDLELQNSTSFVGSGFIKLLLDKDGGLGNSLDIALYSGAQRTFQTVAAGGWQSYGIDGGRLYGWGGNHAHQISTSTTTQYYRLPTQIGSSTGWTQISTGSSHACGLDGGQPYCWGNNTRGQIGDNTENTRTSPYRVDNSTDWTAITTGDFFTCGIDDGKLYCWGSNFDGQIGNGSSGSSNDQLTPDRVGSASNWTAVGAAEDSVCGIRGGELYCWGSNQYGQVGNGTSGSTDVLNPVKIGSLSTWSMVTGGSSHACGIAAGELYCWGANGSGQIGNGDTGGTNVTSPQKIGTFSNWTHITAGSESTCAIRAGELYCWGLDNSNQLGNGVASLDDVYSPQRVGSSSSWTSIDGGRYHMCGVDSGRMTCWGGEERGELGHGSGSGAPVTAAKQIGQSTTWTQAASGDEHSCAIDGGKLYCWGNGRFGRLGNGSYDEVIYTVPQRIGVHDDWTQVSVDFSRSCAIRSGELYCFGVGESNVPTQVGSSTNWSKISVGNNSVCGIDGGELYCWGAGSYGKLGTGNDTSQSSPVKIGSSSNWSTVAVGGNHACGVDGGQLYCWGRDNYNQLGNGSSTSNEYTPDLVDSSTSWTAVTAGSGHSCGIDGGELYCWGLDSSGQVGDGGNSSNKTTPKRVGSSSLWTDITAGHYFTCGVEAGELFCFGSDFQGQIDNGTDTDTEESPVQAGSSSNWASVDSGEFHSCGIDDGKLYCWGTNQDGQAGVRFDNATP